jgi:hypothetical protein
MAQALNGETVVVEGRSLGTVEGCGIIVTWSPAGEADMQGVNDAFAKVGFGKLAPAQRTLKDALRAALVAQYSKKNRRVAPTPRGYEVVDEVATADGLSNEHQHVVSAWIEKNSSGGEVVRCDDTGLSAELVEAVEAARKKVEGAAVAEALATVAQQQLAGTRIRDGGGAYWLPQSSVATWFTLTDALEQVRGGVTTRPFTVSGDERTLQSVIATALAKVDAVVNETYVKIESGKVGPKGLTNQAEQVSLVAEQITVWESALGGSLEALRQKMYDAQMAATRAASLAQQQQDAVAV